jgi:hypothetical protein
VGCGGRATQKKNVIRNVKPLLAVYAVPAQYKLGAQFSDFYDALIVLHD